MPHLLDRMTVINVEYVTGNIAVKQARIQIGRLETYKQSFHPQQSSAQNRLVNQLPPAVER
jgi:hypothetical protein